MPVFLPIMLALQGVPVVQTWHEPLSWLRGIRYLPCAVTKDAFVTVEPNYRALVPRFVWKLLSRKQVVRTIPVGAMIPKSTLTLMQKETIKRRFGAVGRNLVVYFGFAIESKGVEKLFHIAQPSTDRLVLLCELNPENEYHCKIKALMSSAEWSGKALSTGYLSSEEVAQVLSAADAAVFPFTEGMTRRNTSVYAAQIQGTFVLTTRNERCGYDAAENTFYAAPDDLEAMRHALHLHAGEKGAGVESADWSGIAALHEELYLQVHNEKGK
jgi:glycosyltransferase involved in cell wall biosynthesis